MCLSNCQQARWAGKAENNDFLEEEMSTNQSRWSPSVVIVSALKANRCLPNSRSRPPTLLANSIICCHKHWWMSKVFLGSQIGLKCKMCFNKGHYSNAFSSNLWQWLASDEINAVASSRKHVIQTSPCSHYTLFFSAYILSCWQRISLLFFIQGDRPSPEDIKHLHRDGRKWMTQNARISTLRQH